MADEFDEIDQQEDPQDPFKKYGGKQIEDPFKKYGGKSIDVKKKSWFSRYLTYIKWWFTPDWFR